jgi:hypothetical protein
MTQEDPVVTTADQQDKIDTMEVVTHPWTEKQKNKATAAGAISAAAGITFSSYTHTTK